MKSFFQILKFSKLSFFLLTAVLTSVVSAADYTTFLTPSNGFTEVTSWSDMLATTDYYYILASAEDTRFLLEVGAYQAKPDWADENTKALRYVEVNDELLLDPLCYFTIEKSGNYIGFRNIYYCADLFQTHNEAGFMYVNTYTDKNLDEWSWLTPTYVSNEEYWLFESGKYPLSGDAYYSGYLGPWSNLVAEGEALALNRKNTTGDEAGHFRLFRIAKDDYEELYEAHAIALKREQLLQASNTNPIDATWLITNPSFETGDMTGWTMVPQPAENETEMGAKNYPISGKEGGYVGNLFHWWSGVALEQTVTDIPEGIYEVSALVATWEGYTVNFIVDGKKASASGQGDVTGIRLTHTVTVGNDRMMTLEASRTDVDWWSEGRGEYPNMVGFLKLEDVHLTCLQAYFSGTAIPLPNDNTTRLVANQWYYYDVDFFTEYTLVGNISGMVYTTDGTQPVDNVQTQDALRRLSLPRGRAYFKTSRDDATLSISSVRELKQGSVTAAALNVDGLPAKISVVEINPDGPGTSGTKLISSYLALKGYDFIGISEDFDFHSELTQNMTGYSWGTYRGSVSATAVISPANTDGLEMAWKESKVDMTDESWTRWESTASTDGNQYIKKGYRHYVMTTKPEGVIVDVYVLHMDAGDEAKSSREAQWKQLATAINNSDGSCPKLIVGDTNSRWTREDIRTNFVNLLPNYTVEDAWVELYRRGIYPTTDMDDQTNQEDPWNFSAYEVVDKIICLNPKVENSVNIMPTSFHLEQDYTYGMVDGTDSGKPLGDHKPLVVELTYMWAGDAKVIVGDVDGNDEVNVSDVTALVNIILGNAADSHAADVDGNGEVNVSDVTALVNIILGN